MQEEEGAGSTHEELLQLAGFASRPFPQPAAGPGSSVTGPEASHAEVHQPEEGWGWAWGEAPAQSCPPLSAPSSPLSSDLLV